MTTILDEGDGLSATFDGVTLYFVKKNGKLEVKLPDGDRPAIHIHE
jgi:hypothetical protein